MASADDDSRRATAISRFEGGSITVGQVDDAVANKSPYLRRAQLERKGRELLLRAMVDYELLTMEARRRGYADHPKVREMMTHRAIHQLELEVTAGIIPEGLSTEDVEGHYAANRASFGSVPQRRASHVQFRTRAEADAFRQEALGMDVDEFRRLAGRMDETGRGGELGYFDAEGRPGGVAQDKPLDAVLTALAYSLREVGDVSVPTPHEGGFVILRLTAIRPGRGQTLAEVEVQVREHLAADRQRQAVDALVEQLRGQHVPQLRQALLERIELDPVKPLDIPTGFPAAPRDPTAPTVVLEPDGA